MTWGELKRWVNEAKIDDSVNVAWVDLGFSMGTDDIIATVDSNNDLTIYN
jgi:hypothetical protein